MSDQRYCLACGQPASPVRLAFLDVLQTEQHRPAGGLAVPGAGYAPPLEPIGAAGRLRAYAPLFAVLSTLLLAMAIGLLLGHWATQRGPSGPQVVKVEGLSAAAAPAAASAPAPAATASAKKASQAAEEAAEAKAEKAEHAAPAPKPVTVTPSALQKLGSSTGKKHQEEVSKLGSAPIETGGGGGSHTTAPSSTESNKPIGGGSKVESIE